MARPTPRGNRRGALASKELATWKGTSDGMRFSGEAASVRGAVIKIAWEREEFVGRVV